MLCKLYISNGQEETYIGTFTTKEKAENYYNKIKGDIKQLYGYDTKAIAIFVGVKKGRGR